MELEKHLVGNSKFDTRFLGIDQSIFNSGMSEENRKMSIGRFHVIGVNLAKHDGSSISTSEVSKRNDYLWSNNLNLFFNVLSTTFQIFKVMICGQMTSTETQH